MDRQQRRAGDRRGHRAEALAALWLRLRGYRLIHRRYRGLGGEIDLVARRGPLLIAVEVKARPTAAACLAAVTPRQQRRIAAAATELLARDRRFLGCSVRFDVIAICPRRWPVHLVDAWRPGDPRPDR